MRATILALTALALAPPALAQKKEEQRPSEEEIFGTPAQPAPAPAPSEEVAPENPLSMGGQIYLRAATSIPQGEGVDRWAFNSPSLLDVYMDGRPNERVRGFVQGRMSFDPTLPPSRDASLSQNLELQGGTTGAQDLSAFF